MSITFYKIFHTIPILLLANYYSIINMEVECDEKGHTHKRNNCKRYKKMRKRGFLWSVTFLVLIAPLIYYMIHYFANLGDKYYMPFHLAVSSIAIIMIYFLVIILVISAIIDDFKIKNECYQIVTDRLVAITEKVGGQYSRSALAHPYYLHFSRYGRYSVPYENNHEHSEMFCMNDEGLVNYSKEGDDFYLVVLNKKILAAYNKKLFELKEQ